MDRTETAIRGQGARRIGPRQVRDLILAATKAFKRQQALGLTEPGDTFDAWRKAQLWDCVREASFRAVTQGNFAEALARFEFLAGGERRADPAEADRERRARWKLNRTLEDPAINGRFGGQAGARAYAEALFSKIHRTSFADADARQIWQVFYTMNARAARRPEAGGRSSEIGGAT